MQNDAKHILGTSDCLTFWAILPNGYNVCWCGEFNIWNNGICKVSDAIDSVPWSELMMKRKKENELYDYLTEKYGIMETL